jgi:DNA-binding transcriptional LysR family regulator
MSDEMRQADFGGYRMPGKISLQHLRYLVAFAEHRTLTEASANLNVSQPAISRALKELQAELGCQLLRRVGRSLELTTAGQRVLASARRALAAIDDMQRVAGEQSAHVLRIATLGAMAAGMAPVLERFMRKEPLIRIQIQHMAQDHEMFDQLRRGDVDVGYCGLVKRPRGLSITPTRPLGIVLASPIGTDLPAAVRFADLDGLPMVMPPLTEERRRLFDDPCSRAGALPDIVLESGDTTTFLSSIQAGIASSIMWDVNAVQSTDIEIRPFDPPRFHPVGFVHVSKPTALVRKLLSLSRKVERERERTASRQPTAPKYMSQVIELP